MAEQLPAKISNNNSRSKVKSTNARVPSKKHTIENLLKIYDQKLKSTIDRENYNAKQVMNTSTPLSKTLKTNAKVINESNEIQNNRIPLNSSFKKKNNTNINNSMYTHNNNNKTDNSVDMLIDTSLLNNNHHHHYHGGNSNGNGTSGDSNSIISKKYIQKSPQKYHTNANINTSSSTHHHHHQQHHQNHQPNHHKRFSSSLVGSQKKIDHNTNGNNNNNTNNSCNHGSKMEKKKEIKRKYTNHLMNSMLGDDNLYSRDMSYNKENNNDIDNITLIMNQNLHISNIKNDEGEVEHEGDIFINENDDINDVNLNQQLNEDNVFNEVFENGKQFYRQRKYDEALKCFKESIKTGYKINETKYLIGICYLWSGEYEIAIQELMNLMENEDFYHKNIYLLVSIAYKKLNNHVLAIKMLTKAISKFPKYYDAFIYRGKLYIKLKQWDKALYDFKTAVQINPEKGLGYIGQGDCSRMMGEHEEAVILYTNALNKEKYLYNVGLLKRSIAYIELKKYDEGLADLENLLLTDTTNSEAYYFKGFIFQKKKDYNEAILCFEQAIKHNNSKKAVIKSLYEIAKIKIENKDFYEAYYTLRRIDFMQLDPKILDKFRLFTEGVIYMMKRKHNEGIESLSTILIKHPKSDFLKPLTYNYRAYGYYCIGEIKKALEDYIELQKLTKLDQSSQYNRYLCEGILYAEQENYENAFTYFNNANKIFKNKIEPYFYKACLQIYIQKKSNNQLDPKALQQTLATSIKDIEKAIEYNDSNSNLLYHYGTILYCMGKFKDALKIIEKAIEKAEENYAKYYHVRGLIQSAIKNYQNAISDFSIAINIDKNYQNAYLERGRCYFSYGDLKSAFLDIQKFISIMPNDSNVHFWAGNLLFNTGAFDDAARAYSNSDGINESEKLLLLRAKCYIALKELNSALADLNRMIELDQNNTQAIFDRDCLISLKIATTAKPDGKIDFINVAQASKKLSKLVSFKTAGHIFKLYDFYLYKAIIHFYSQEYVEALNSLDSAWDHKEKARQEWYMNKKAGKKEVDGNYDQEKVIKIFEEFCSDTEGDDAVFESIGNTSFTTAEYLYNRAIILLMMKKNDSAYESLMNLLKISSSESTEKIEYLMKTIKNINNPQDLNPEKDSDDQEIICVFSTENRLCSIFPPILLDFKTKQIQTSFSFCLPSIEPPPMTPSISYEILNDITVMSVENRPEAPWIRRNEVGVIFTENYLDKEESEIENLNEIIVANNLKEEDIYASLDKPSDLNKQNKDSSNEGIFNDNNIRKDDDNIADLDIFNEPIVVGRIKRSRTGTI